MYKSTRPSIRANYRSKRLSNLCTLQKTHSSLHHC